MVSKACLDGVSCLAKARSREMLIEAMAQPIKPPRSTRKKSPVVVVHVMFEPNRLTPQCLQDAYACLIPTVLRRLNASLPNCAATGARWPRCALELRR